MFVWILILRIHREQFFENYFFCTQHLPVVLRDASHILSLRHGLTDLAYSLRRWRGLRLWYASRNKEAGVCSVVECLRYDMPCTLKLKFHKQQTKIQDLKLKDTPDISLGSGGIWWSDLLQPSHSFDPVPNFGPTGKKNSCWSKFR